MDDIKNFLYSFLGKQHQTPVYDFSQIIGKNKQSRFKCEVNKTNFIYSFKFQTKT